MNGILANVVNNENNPVKVGNTEIGELNDFVAVPYQAGTNSILGYLATIYQHLQGQPHKSVLKYYI